MNHALGELAVNTASDATLIWNGNNWDEITSEPITTGTSAKFINTIKGQERLEEMFMEWMKQKHPEDLL